MVSLLLRKPKAFRIFSHKARLIKDYSWLDVGSSYVLSDLLAAFLLAQLEARAQIQSERRAIWETYETELRGWADEHGVRLPSVPETCEQSFHMFYLLMPSMERRDALIRHLRSAGILAVSHYLPLHLSSMGRRLGRQVGDCPVTEDVSPRLVRLPFFAGLTRDLQSRVIGEIQRCGRP